MVVYHRCRGCGYCSSQPDNMPERVQYWYCRMHKCRVDNWISIKCDLFATPDRIEEDRFVALRNW